MVKIKKNNIIFVLGLVIALYFYFLPVPLFASDGTSRRDSAMASILAKAEAKQGGDKAEFKPNQSERETGLAKDILPMAEQKDALKQLAGDKHFELGSEVSNIVYKEPDVMREKGLMYGVYGAFVYYGWIPLLPFNYYARLPNLPEDRSKTQSMVKIEGKFSTGHVDYRNSGAIDDIRDYMWETRILVGPVFYNNKIAAVPYLGFGYRYLNDDSGGKRSSTGAYGYERESNYYYLPLGASLITGLSHGWFLEINTEFDVFLGGKQKSHLSDVTPAYSDLSNDQDDGYGLRGSLKIRKELEAVDFVIEPFIKYWNIKKSEESNVFYNNVIIGYGYEPKNNSTEYGVKLAVRF